MGKNALLEIDELSFYIKSGINAVDAIQIAMSDSMNDAKSFTDGLWYVCTMLEKQSNKLENAINKCAEGV